MKYIVKDREEGLEYVIDAHGVNFIQKCYKAEKSLTDTIKKIYETLDTEDERLMAVRVFLKWLRKSLVSLKAPSDYTFEFCVPEMRIFNLLHFAAYRAAYFRGDIRVTQHSVLCGQIQITHGEAHYSDLIIVGKFSEKSTEF
jgi:hypothetical protein